MSTTDLVKIEGGQGLANLGSSKLMQLKPGTLVINQRMTEAKGAELGKFRIVENGMQFDEMTVALLSLPREQRDYYEGTKRTPDTLMCFSRDMVAPHPKARVMQAATCQGCIKSSWEKYNQTKDIRDIPPCDASYVAMFIDTVYKLPLRMYIRGASKSPFEIGMQEIARRLYMLQAQGSNPSVYDIVFTIKPEQGKKNNYVLSMSDFRTVTPIEREQFGAIYNTVVDRPTPPAVQQAVVQEAIDAEIVAESANTVEGEDVEI